MSDAPIEILTCGLTRADVVRPGTLPVRNADWFEHHFPGDFIVERSKADARLVLRARDHAVRPARVLLVRQPA